MTVDEARLSSSSTIQSLSAQNPRRSARDASSMLRKCVEQNSARPDPSSHSNSSLVRFFALVLHGSSRYLTVKSPYAYAASTSIVLGLLKYRYPQVRY